MEEINKLLEKNKEKNKEEIKKPNKNYILFDWNKLSNHLKKELTDNPNIFFKGLNLQLVKKFKTKERLYFSFTNIPKEYKTTIWDLSKDKLNKFILVQGKIEQISKIITKAKKVVYECPSCGSIFNIVNLDERLPQPTRCSCGRKGKFRLVKTYFKDYYQLELLDHDNYSILVELNEMFLNPEFKKFIKKGKEIIVSGELIGEFKKLPRGNQSNEIDKKLIANYVEEVK